MVIVDENIDSSLIFKLRKSGFKVFSIKENIKGESMEDKVVELLKNLSNEITHKFITITHNKIKIKEI